VAYRFSMMLMLMVVGLLQRSTSPSIKMTTLSRQFTGKVGANLRVGARPIENKSTLSREVQSEINVTKIGRIDIANSRVFVDHVCIL
jgi:hypothetical protein